jgi:hypothetical protein
MRERERERERDKERDRTRRATQLFFVHFIPPDAFLPIVLITIPVVIYVSAYCAYGYEESERASECFVLSQSVRQPASQPAIQSVRHLYL